MQDAYICDGVRTPFGRFAGSLSGIRADDLGAIPLKKIIERNSQVDWSQLDDVVMGCANQAGEDNRNVARMSLLLAGIPVTVPGVTVNRLCASSLEATSIAARAIKANEASLIIAGGVESMSRAPYVIGKGDSSFSRNQSMQDTTIGWRFINQIIKEKYGVDTMPETAENVAEQFNINRDDQDQFAFRSQNRLENAQKKGYLAEEITPVTIKDRRGTSTSIDLDEHPRPNTTIEKLGALKPIVKTEGTITAGNSSGINDGAGAILLASEQAINLYNLKPLARVVNSLSIGLEPRIMGYGPTLAIKKLLSKTELNIEDIGVIELNEAFASQALAVIRDLGLSDDTLQVNPNGGAIAIGHPLGASGVRLIISAVNQMHRKNERYGICTMCVGVGQGVAVLIEKI
jgi:3-oxoadipyl-CoA thiolase